jgi:Ca2+-binding EF-hand superfamily protein
MRIEEAATKMTTQYLTRVLTSFTKDLGRLEEDEARDYITRNAEELARPENIERRLDLFDVDHSTRVAVHYVLEVMLNTPGCALDERDVVERVREREQRLLDEAAKDDALQYTDEHCVDILRTVLEVAFEDGTISRDEYGLIERLRQKLQITLKQQRIMEAKMGVFPSPGGDLHTPSELNEALLYLQRQGIIFYCNRAEDGRAVVLPEELHVGVKKVLGIELSDNARQLLWKNMTNAVLSDVLRSQNLPISGTKDERSERLLLAETKPSEGLDSLMNDDLYGICGSLPGVNVSGTKNERVDRIIAHFDNLMIREVPDDADPAVLYYEYFTELAKRDRENLLANDVISKDIDIERAFEEATRYLFRHKLGVELMDMPGSDHPDGCIEMHDGSLLMWDNKSTESNYTFPNSHLKQFKRYIRDSIEKRVTCFMVIVPEVDEVAEENCLRLKFESQQDADVCIVTAEDLKWVAENWESMTKKEAFNLAVFDQQGLLGRKRLEQVMRVLM